MKFIIIVLNVTNGTFIYSSGQPFKQLAPFSQSNRVVSFCKVSLMFDGNTFWWGISRGSIMLIFRRYPSQSTMKSVSRSKVMCRTDMYAT